MHYLHKILVDTKHNDLPDIDDIRDFAETETEQYFHKVFDWRETDTAGRWAEEYPINVIRGIDNAQKLIEEVEEVAKWQNEKIEYYIEQIKTFNVETLDEVVDKTKKEEKFSLLPFYLKQLASILYGEYIDESNFYDTENMDARVTNELLEAVKAHLEEFALVFFDCHN